MTWTVKMADARYDGYEEGFDEGREAGIQVGIQQGIEQGIERGAYETKLETAKAMFLDKIPVETISKYTSLPLETVLELAQEI
ncbi:MAG: hypothetical protein IKW26_11290 [Treponema sp.]|nr:hypothetical protein [Treponema sp.]